MMLHGLNFSPCTLDRHMHDMHFSTAQTRGLLMFTGGELLI